MARSPQYRALLRNLRELRRYLLPKTFDPTGDYSDRVLTRTLGYRLLVHAEIEAYLEDRAREKAIEAVRSWKSDGHIGRVAVSLLAFCGFEQEKPPKTLEPDQPTQKIQWEQKTEVDRKLERAAKAFHYAVDNNHGIKEENLLQLLLPIGIPPSNLDPFWVASLNSFGEKRGEAAHSSVVVYRTHQPPDPESEHREVRAIVDWLRLLDQEISRMD